MKHPTKNTFSCRKFTPGTAVFTAVFFLFTGSFTASLTGCSSGRNVSESTEAALPPESASEPVSGTAPHRETQVLPENNAAVLSDPALIVKDSITSMGSTPHLEPDTDYFFDMDSDGTAEKIYFTLTPSTAEGESDLFTLHVFINEEEILTHSPLYENTGTVYITDADRDDSLLELHCQWTMESDTLSLYNFIRYEDSTVTNLGDLSGMEVLYRKGTLYRCGETKFNGDGTFSVEADTPVYSPTIGCYFCPLTFALTEGGISEIIKNEYAWKTLTAGDDTPYLYRAAIEFDTYSSPEGAAVSYHVSPGETVTFKKLKFRDDGVICVLAQNESGENGWFYASDSILFEEVPGWG